MCNLGRPFCTGDLLHGGPFAQGTFCTGGLFAQGAFASGAFVQGRGSGDVNMTDSP